VKNKILTIISVIVVIIILFLARTIYSDHNLKKVIGACILAQTQTSNLEEAKQICVDKFKLRSFLQTRPMCVRFSLNRI